MWQWLLSLLYVTETQEPSYVELALDPKFSLGWIFLPDESSIQFNFTVGSRQCRLSGWCGIGFNGSMVNTDMIIVATNYDDVVAWDMYSTGFQQPQNDTAIGGYNNIELISGQYSNSITQAVVARLLITNDTNYDAQLSIGLTTPFIFAYYDLGEAFNYHVFEASGFITFGANQSSSSFFQEYEYTDYYKTHGITLGVAWMPVMLISVIAARHFKFYWLWYWVHLAAGIYIFIVTYIYGVWAYMQDKPDIGPTVMQYLYHNRMGFTIMSFLPAQLITGFVTRWWTWKTKSTQALYIVRRMHYFSGWALWVSAQIAIYYGVQCYKPDQLYLLKWAFPLLAVILIGFEVWHQLSSLPNRKVNKPGIGYLTFGKRRKFTYAEVYDLVSTESRKLVYLDNLVLDIHSFIDSHPGGSILLYNTLGEDYGKYIYGVTPAEGQRVGFKHPQIVWKYVSKLCIGEVDCHLGVVLCRSGPPALQSMRWTLSSKFRITPGVFCFSFTSDTLFVSGRPKGMDWVGSHFRVTAKINGSEVNRYYSLCLFFNVENLQRWYASNKKQGFTSRLMSDKFSGANTTLDLVAREYAPHGKMSTFLHAMEPGTPLTITGPMGPGLLLTPNLTGHFCAFGAGTGILPFLDLVEYLWWKELDTLDGSQRLTALTGFHLTLYASFAKEDDIIGHDLLQSTHDLCAKDMDPRFKLVLYTDARKTEDRSALVAGVFSKIEAQRVWVCGPSGFCTWVKGIALEIGVNRKKIIIM